VRYARTAVGELRLIDANFTGPADLPIEKAEACELPNAAIALMVRAATNDKRVMTSSDWPPGPLVAPFDGASAGRSSGPHLCMSEIAAQRFKLLATSALTIPAKKAEFY
jgi:hypothetical protein